MWLEWQGQPIAAEYLLISGQAVRAYQSGKNPKVADLSPGFLANLVVIQQAIAEGHSLFDFLRGDEPYKAEWGARPVEMFRIRAVPSRPMVRLRLAFWRVARICRNKLRKEKKDNKGDPFAATFTQLVSVQDVSQKCQGTTDEMACSICD